MDPQNQAPQPEQQPPVQPQAAETIPTTSMDSMATPEVVPEVAPAEAVVATPVAAPVNTYLVMSIVSFVVGGGLFGLLAIIFSVMAKNALKAGNVNEAEAKAKWAKVLAIVGIVAAVLWWAGMIMIMTSGVLNV